jgi:hypothetical protein
MYFRSAPRQDSHRDALSRGPFPSILLRYSIKCAGARRGNPPWPWELRVSERRPYTNPAPAARVPGLWAVADGPGLGAERDHPLCAVPDGLAPNQRPSHRSHHHLHRGRACSLGRNVHDDLDERRNCRHQARGQFVLGPPSLSREWRFSRFRGNSSIVQPSFRGRLI